MMQRSRALACCALLGVVLVLSGCAAGSPAVVAPTPSVETALELELVAPEATIAAPAVTDDAPEVAIASAPLSEASASGDSSVQDAASQPAPAPDASGTAGFSQDVPAPILQTPGDEGFAANPEPADVQLAPAAQTARPAAPPDPGTGLSQLIEGGTNGRLEVALTFDAGADTGYGPQILDFLRDEGISATFGMTGAWAQANPDLVQRMVSEGHQLINHTWDHSSLTGANTGLPALTPEQITAQLADTEGFVRDLTGYDMRPYFRPPYGDYDEPTLRYLYENGYYLSIWWTCDSHGWAGWGAQEIIDYCTTNIAEDEILLLHVGAAAAGDFEALPGLIQFFRDSGYAFVTVEQMLQP
jgi:peptidoglycan/xylan/chitin deacetylase (PgdA/CDA1 family)